MELVVSEEGNRAYGNRIWMLSREASLSQSQVTTRDKMTGVGKIPALRNCHLELNKDFNFI